MSGFECKVCHYQDHCSGGCRRCPLCGAEVTYKLPLSCLEITERELEEAYQPRQFVLIPVERLE